MQQRLDAAEAQSRAQGRDRLVPRKRERLGIVAVALVGDIAHAATQHAVQGNALPRVEQMIDTDRDTRAVSGERLITKPMAGSNLVVVVCESSAIEADADIAARPQCVTDAQFAVEINRGDGETQRSIGLAELRPIQVVEHVGADRRMALQRLLVTELEELARNRIDLCRGSRRDDRRTEQRKESEAMSKGQSELGSLLSACMICRRCSAVMALDA